MTDSQNITNMERRSSQNAQTLKLPAMRSPTYSLKGNYLNFGDADLPISGSAPNTSGSASGKKNNLVLSTSFVSSRRFDNGSPSPTSPLQTRSKRDRSMSRTKQSLKTDIIRLQHELNQVLKQKENVERARDANVGSNMFTNEYSTEHLQKHSMRIKINTQLREMDKTIKRLEQQINDLKFQCESSKKSDLVEPSLNKRAPKKEFPIFQGIIQDYDLNHSSKSDSNESVTHGSNTPKKKRDNSTHTADTARSKTSPVKSEFGIKDDLCEDEEDEEENDTTVLSSDSGENINKKENRAVDIESATWYISDYMESLHETNVPTDFIVDKANKLTALLTERPELRADLVLTSFMQTIQSLLLKDDKLIVAAAFRICRYLINGEEFIQYLHDLRIDAFIIISLAKDNSFQIEREQALKITRKMAEYKSGITKGMLQAIISCVERTDDVLRTMAIETLLEMCLLQPEMVSNCHGLYVLEDLIQEYSSFSLVSIILDTILGLLNNHSTRQFFLMNFDITVLATVFSDTSTRKTSNTEKFQNAIILICRALKNHNGFMLYCTNNFKPIKELLSLFQIPLCAHYLIDIFLDILRIRPLMFKNRRRNSVIKTGISDSLRDALPINQYLALIIQVLDECHFHDYIGELLNHKQNDEFTSSVIMKARYLLIEYFNLRMNLVDREQIPKFSSLSMKDMSLNEEVFQFRKISHNMNKHRNTIGMSQVNYVENMKRFTQKARKSTLVSEVDDLRFRQMVYDSRVLQTKDFTNWNWNIIQELLEGPLMNKRQLEELAKSTKFIRRLLVFYRPLRLRFSNVDKGARLAHKYVQTGCQFFRTLTTNSEGMKILLDDTKIIPQLASLLFRAMEGNTQENIFNEETLQSKVVYGYFKFIGVLTQSENGVNILTRWNFFTVIYKMFQPELSIGSEFLVLVLPELDPTYSAHCRTIIGKALVIPQESIRVRATHHIGKQLNAVMKDTFRDDRNDDHTSLDMKKFTVEMLTRQLYDASPNVVATADQALYECIVDTDVHGEMNISFRTFLDQMVFIQSPVIFELLSSPYGFQLLNEINFVEQERKLWLECKNREYVTKLEDFLAATQNKSLKLLAFTVENRLPLHFYESLAKTEDGITLLSQNGDLVKFINVVKSYSHSIGAEDESTIDIMEVKSALWCCGYIGSTELGVGLIDNYSVAEDFVKIAYDADNSGMKFTAFCVLGLIGRTIEGCEILDELGWSCTISVQGKPVGIALPRRLDKFLSYKEKPWILEHEYEEEMIEFYTDTQSIINTSSVPSIDYNLDNFLEEKNSIDNPLNEKDPNKCDASAVRRLRTKSLDAMAPNSKDYGTGMTTRFSNGNKNFAARKQRSHTINTQLSDSNVLNEEMANIVEKVVETVSQLGNHILSNSAIKQITDLNNKYGSVLFESEIVFGKVMEMMDTYRFKPHVRKFLCGLVINKRSLENVIKNDTKRRG
ncbi:TORC2 complex subunit TSC11 KNAG_0C03620 [Huiozyma naganishii CBS 8797]|uniref:REM-1 domain-containing protein n=1 Tax=Huiozyma naganishii (strain ATCC MYA-139 / BCRC 22969 / CBS 8797 / KCTC 17520 / NBRC 10181 / NCYC 3082 / Yp74L-3) TaxID=1071383 RepID=J7S621_HUIN7|nr:hypothetical protein KNAG_0C03620 [Kazachstania naganishii CBS 8797]CCK69466.1 hypothetical protein KNAG_0C03620 [Kazachstania naganishii CBS 8797]